MNGTRAALFACLLLSLSGCARKVAFTSGIRQAIGSSERLTSLQFFMGERCRLERVSDRTAGQIQGGQLVYQQGRAVNIVNIPKGTPGVAVAVHPQRLGVSFEEGAVLFFGSRPEEGQDSLYYLLGRWDQAGRFHVQYRGVDYVQTSERPCTLDVPSNFERSFVREERTVGGQRVSNP